MDEHNIIFLFIYILSISYLYIVTSLSDICLIDLYSLESVQKTYINELTESICNNPLSKSEFKIGLYDLIIISNSIHQKMKFLESYQSSIILSILLIIISTIYLVSSLLLTSLKDIPFLEDLYKRYRYLKIFNKKMIILNTTTITTIIIAYFLDKIII